MMRDNYIDIIENVTGRKVRAFLSQNHIDPAIATEIFVLEPEGGDEISDVQGNSRRQSANKRGWSTTGLPARLIFGLVAPVIGVEEGVSETRARPIAARPSRSGLYVPNKIARGLRSAGAPAALDAPTRPAPSSRPR